MIDVAKEKLLTIAQAAERLQVSKATVTTWIKGGTNGVRLDAIRFGMHWRTSEEAIQRFGDCQTPNFDSDKNRMQPKRTSASVQRYQEQVRDELDELLGVRKCTTCREKIDTGNVPIRKDTKLWCPKCIVERKSAGIGKRIQSFRWARQLSLQALHKSTGLSVERIRDFEREKRKPDAEHLKRLVEFFGSELVKNLEPNDTGQP